MVVVVAATGGVQPALGPRPLKSSRALHRAGTLTLASPSAPSALLQPSAARPSDLRPLQTQVKKIPKITTRSAATQAASEAKRRGTESAPPARSTTLSGGIARPSCCERSALWASGECGGAGRRASAALRGCCACCAASGKWVCLLACFAYPAASHSGTALAR